MPDLRAALLHATAYPCAASPLTTVDILTTTDLPGLARTTTRALRCEADRMERDGLTDAIPYPAGVADDYRALADRIHNATPPSPCTT